MVVLATTSLFPLAQKFPADIFLGIGMQILVLPPQDSCETCLGIIVRGKCDRNKTQAWELYDAHGEWLGEAMYPNKQMLVTPTQVQIQHSKVY